MKRREKLSRQVTVVSAIWILACFGTWPPYARAEERPCDSGAAALEAGRAEEALRLYQSCLAAGPSFAAFKGLAETYSILGQYEDSINNFRFALALNPEDSDSAAGLGQALIKLGRYEEAAHALEREVVNDPDNLRARNLVAMAFFQLKEYELAAMEAGEILRREPSNISAAFILGASEVRLGLNARAVPLLERAAAAAPSAEIRATLGKAYLGIHQGSRALREFRAAEKMDPRIPGLYSQIGAAYAELGEKDSTLSAYEKALEADPNDFAANFGLARLNWSEGHYDAAEKYLAQSRQAAPDDPEVQLLSAEISMHAQDYARAKPLLENAVRARPDNLRAHVLLSQVYFHLQQMDDAKREEGIANALRESEEKQREKAAVTPRKK